MKRLLVGGAILALAVSGLGTSFAGTADGQGAQKSDISASTGGKGDCESGDGVARKGFAILNAPGKEGEVKKIVGEVSLKEGAPDTTYTVFLATGGNCMMLEDMLTTNGQGNGNAHVDFPISSLASEYYVVLESMSTDETLASQPVPLR